MAEAWRFEIVLHFIAVFTKYYLVGHKFGFVLTFNWQEAWSDLRTSVD